jgi:hypothetical protein
MQKPGDKPNDYSAVTSHVSAALNSETVAGRTDNLRSAVVKLDKLYKDEFYTKVVAEWVEVTERQKVIYQRTKD